MKLKSCILLFITMLFLCGCTKTNMKMYYENAEGTIYKITEDTELKTYGKVLTRVAYLDIYLNDGLPNGEIVGVYRIRKNLFNEDLLRIGNEVKLKIDCSNRNIKYINSYDVLSDNNTKMRDLLIKDIKELEK